ncbi:MAG: LLM class flavin-dependent oxidoreductase [Nitrospinota bacterium]
MKFGLMLRGQFPLADDMHLRLQEMLAQVRTAHRLGYDSITKGQHYSGHPFQGPQQLPFLAMAAAVAPGIRLNAGIVLLSLHKPLDLAEQLATIDVASGGKLIFGVGLGYREVEFRAFGTTQRERVPRMVENLEAIRRLWAEEKVTLKGSHFELIEASCPIKPLQKPHPPIWIGANTDPGVRRAARLGDCWYINPHNRLDTIERQMEVYRRALEEAGKPFPAELPMRREAFVARTREEALRLCRPYLETKYQSYHAWGQGKAMPKEDNKLDQEFSALLEERFLIGSPEEVAQQIVRLNRRIGVNHLIMSIQWPGMPQSLALETMHLFAEEVFPRVRRSVP